MIICFEVEISVTKSVTLIIFQGHSSSSRKMKLNVTFSYPHEFKFCIVVMFGNDHKIMLLVIFIFILLREINDSFPASSETLMLAFSQILLK